MIEETLTTPLLEIRDLHVRFDLDHSTVSAVNGASITVGHGETVCMVGETGAGKSVTALSVLRLLGSGGATTRARTSGTVLLRPRSGRSYDLLTLEADELREVRGRHVAMVYQEPMNSLNPVYTCGNQIGEVLRRRPEYAGGGQTRSIRRGIEDLLRSVGIPDPERRTKAFPHELSGGMRQRVMIGMALALQPLLLIADEPTTALDVTIQAQILKLFQEIQRTSGTSILFITHDLSVVAQLADRVVVMYAGYVVETAPVLELFAAPRHPYTRGLLEALPQRVEPGSAPERLRAIPGAVPNPAALPTGCPFHPRCAVAVGACLERMPDVTTISRDHTVRCHLASGQGEQ